MKIRISFILVLLALLSCKNEKPESSLEELFEVEKQFSDMSVQHGMVAAFNHFCAAEGVLLRPESYPIVGKEKVGASYAQTPDSLFSLSWEPFDGRIAKSGELGYTYGIYTLAYKADDTPSQKGTYVTIWKKNTEGIWKFLLDTGQDGLEKQSDILN